MEIQSSLHGTFDYISYKKRGAAEADAAFKKIKEICAEVALLCYPNYNKMFVIHIDANDYQMGGVISQDRKAIAY